MVRTGELVMLMELHRQGLSPTAIARQLGIDRKTVRIFIALASSRRATARGRRDPRQPMPSWPICAIG